MVNSSSHPDPQSQPQSPDPQFQPQSHNRQPQSLLPVPLIVPLAKLVLGDSGQYLPYYLA